MEQSEEAEQKAHGTGEALTVAYDAKRALRNGTGLGNYSRYTIEVMSAAYRDMQCRMYAAAGSTDRVASLLARDNVSLHTPAGGMSRRFPTLWRSRGMGRQAAREGATVFHGLSNEVPAGIAATMPSVVTIHDVIWRRYPSDYSAIDRRIYDYKYGRSARAATRVIAISECTRADLITDFGIPEEKIDVIYQGIDSSFRPASAEDIAMVREAYSLPERYIVGVGTIQGRKNQLLAVKALRSIDDDVQLVLVGRCTAYAREIAGEAARLGVSHRVTMLENVPFAHLPALYSGAAVASYPSRYEGFGLPVVEAIACGTPVIAATGSCLEEAGGPGAVYVSPDDTEAFADAAMRIIGNGSVRSQMVSEGNSYIARFNTGTFARKTMECYKRAINEY